MSNLIPLNFFFNFNFGLNSLRKINNFHFSRFFSLGIQSSEIIKLDLSSLYVTIKPIILAYSTLKNHTLKNLSQFGCSFKESVSTVSTGRSQKPDNSANVVNARPISGFQKS